MKKIPRRRLFASKRNLTLSASNTTRNDESQCTAKSTAPSNSPSILAISSATHRRSSLVSVIKASTDRVAIIGREKLSWITDNRGEVAGLIVERALGIQARLPSIQPTANATS